MSLIGLILVLLNGQAVEFKDEKPFVKDGRVMVPLREMFEKMGARVTPGISVSNVKVNYNGLNIYVGIREKTIDITGSDNAFTDAEAAPPIITRLILLNYPIKKDGRIFIPVRFVAEAMRAQVQWQADTREVFITAPKEKPSIPVAAKPIEVALKSDKQNYRAGETVNFTITARNTTEENQTLNFNSGQSFDIAVTPRKGSTPAWRWSHDQAFTDALREQALKPNQTVSFSAIWNQTDNSGKPMPRGEYSISAQLSANDGMEAPNLLVKLDE